MIIGMGGVSISYILKASKSRVIISNRRLLLLSLGILISSWLMVSFSVGSTGLTVFDGHCCLSAYSTHSIDEWCLPDGIDTDPAGQETEMANITNVWKM